MTALELAEIVNQLSQIMSFGAGVISGHAFILVLQMRFDS